MIFFALFSFTSVVFVFVCVRIAGEATLRLRVLTLLSLENLFV